MPRSPSPVRRRRKAAAASDTAPPQQAGNPQTQPQTECATFEGERFTLPLDVSALGDGGKLLRTVPDIPTAITWVSLLFITYVALPNRFTMFGFVDWPCLDGLAALTGLRLSESPPHYTLVVFALWRLAYNVGLAMVLRWQSDTQFITHWLIATDESPTALSRVTNWSLGHTLHMPAADVAQLQPQFRAWMVGRYLVNFILPSDGWAFVVVALKYADINVCDLSTTMCISVSVSVSIGAVLVWASLKTKLAAHRVLSIHGWFYGDCFFLLTRTLTFDGVFAETPHPMYGLGYMWTYGAAIMARSYTVLAVALVAHLMQLLLFLQLFEARHIERLYGSSTVVETSKISPTSSAGGRKPANAFVIVNFDPYRSGDWALAVAICLKAALVALVAVAFPSMGQAVAVGNAMFWQAVHTGLTSYVLWVEDNRDRAFSRRFTSREAAFAEFQRICNFLRTFATASFLLAAVVLFRIPAEYGVATPRFVADVLLGTALILLSVYNFRDSIASFGTHGLYSADFFVDDAPSLSYTGLHRYLNHPSLVLGPLYLYGLSLIAHSMALLPVAVFAHALSIAHVAVVEGPHLRRRYGDAVRSDAPLEAAAKNAAKKMRNKWVQAAKRRFKIHLTPRGQ